MDRERYQRAKSIFLDAIDLPGPERPAYVTSACGDDAELRQEVESLLAFEAPDDYLASPIDSTWLESETFARLLSESGLPEEDASAEQDALLGQTVSNYRVLERIGHGGMGVVYLAEDLRLQRRAALKFLKPSLMLSDARARFLREALVTAQLDHPNVCTLYGVQETPDDQVFLAMAYYQGGSLKERLTEGPLPLQEALDIARQIARGLQAAHDLGIVHRDIKPGNIMLSRGVVKILDFGISKLVNQSGLTLPGIALGTAAYTAPEQAKGESVDHRADIWALGVVLHEMLAGTCPFEGSPVAFLASAARSESVETIELRVEAPETVRAILRNALVVAPSRRYQSARDVEVAIDEVLTGGGAEVSPRSRPEAGRQDVSPSGTAGTASTLRVFAAAPPVDQREADDLGPDLSDALADRLSRISGVTVIRGVSASAVEAASRSERFDLKVTAWRPAAGKVRVEVELADASTRPVGERWGETCDDEQVSSLLSSLVGSTTRRMGRRLTADETELAPGPVLEHDAYLLVIRGYRLLREGTLRALGASRGCFKRAAQLAPHHALPLAGLAECGVELRERNCVTDDDGLTREIRQWRRRALELAPTMLEVRRAAAGVAHHLDWSPSEALDGLAIVLEGNPGDVLALARQAECLLAVGRTDEAAATARLVARLDPVSRVTSVRAARVLHVAREYEESARVLQAMPRMPASARFELALALAKSGRRRRASDELERALAEPTGRVLLAGAVGSAARGHGRGPECMRARRFLRNLESQGHPVPPCCFAWLNVQFGDTGRPLEYLADTGRAFDPLKLVGLTPIAGSLSSLVPRVGLLAYFGIDPGFAFVYQTAAYAELVEDIQSS